MRIHVYFDIRGTRGPIRMETRKEASASDKTDASENGTRMQAQLEATIDNLFEIWQKAGIKCERGVRNSRSRVTFAYRPARRQPHTYWEILLDENWLLGGHSVTTSNLVMLFVAIMGRLGEAIRLGSVAEKLSAPKMAELDAVNNDITKLSDAGLG